MEQHDLFDGKLHLYKRDNSRFWQCSTYLAGKNRRVSTQQEELDRAKAMAEEWYMELKFMQRKGDIHDGKTFREVANQFLREYEVITQGQRSPESIEGHRRRLTLHLLPYFGHRAVEDMHAGLVQEYRIHRRETSVAKRGKPPSRSSMHKDIVTLRQVLKTATRHGWLKHLPDLSEPYRTSEKISHRAWFSPDEYRKLYEATRRRAQHP
ncbi:MAG TPA: site-specific integrase, partial [bacterium]